MKLLFPVCVFLIATIAQAQIKFPALDASGFEQLKAMVNSILSNCPPPKCLVVFPGRSNVLLSAYMEAKKIGRQVSLPVSGIRRMDTESVSKAKPRFTQEILEIFLKPELKSVEKVVIVDFVNGGGSIANASLWIQEYAELQNNPVIVEALSYGHGVASDIEKTLEKSSIKVKNLSFGMAAGSPTHLASASILEKYAAYDEWNPVSTSAKPSINRKLRRPYPYLDEGKKSFTQYASYDDLVDWFKKEEFVPQVQPQNCLVKTLGGML